MATYQNVLLRLQNYVCESDSDLTAELLRALLEHAPTQTGREYLAQEVAHCNDDDELRQLSLRYFSALIAPMRVHGGKTPVASDQSSRPSPAIDEANMEHLIDIATRDRNILKKLCLRRDSLRCVVSGRVDYESFRNKLVGVPEGEFVANTVAAHIIPFSIAAKSGTAANVKRFCAMYEILESFGGIELDEPKGNQINSVENVFTLTDTVHYAFGRLDIWLDVVEGHKDTYRFHKAFPECLDLPNETLITFHQGHPNIPLPDPRYIAVHAACAKVLRASGAAEVIDRYLRDYEEMKVLAPDGSSSQLLENALKMVSIA